MMDTDGTHISNLTTDYDNFPVWSPRGDTIAFIRRLGHNFNIFTIHPDGSALTQLSTTHGNDAHLAWSHDGTRILFTSGRMGFKDEALLTGNPQPYGEIFVMNADGSQVEQLTDNQREEGGPAWLPAKTAPSTATAAVHTYTQTRCLERSENFAASSDSPPVREVVLSDQVIFRSTQ